MLVGANWANGTVASYHFVPLNTTRRYQHFSDIGSIFPYWYWYMDNSSENPSKRWVMPLFDQSTPSQINGHRMVKNVPVKFFKIRISIGSSTTWPIAENCINTPCVYFKQHIFKETFLPLQPYLVTTRISISYTFCSLCSYTLCYLQGNTHKQKHQENNKLCETAAIRHTWPI